MFIDLEDDFHQFRAKGIGSSDIPVIMGVSPYRTLYNLWLEKTGMLSDEKKFKGNYATQRGIDLEPMIRDWFNKKYNRNMVPRRFISNIDEVWRANIDGFDEQHNSLIEIKTASKEVFETAKRGSVPAQYYPQIQWQLMVSNAKGGAFIAYNETQNEYAVVPVRPDIEYFEIMKDAARKFWNLVQTKQVPIMQHKDYEPVEINAKTLLKSLASVDAKLEQLNKKREEIINKIRPMVEHKAYGGGYRFYWSERKGNIDYKAIDELKGVDLERYRKPNYSVFTVKKID